MKIQTWDSWTKITKNHY